MTEISRSALLPYSAEKVYALINDVESYPEFMEGCAGAEVLARDEQSMEARLDLSRRGISYSIITRNTLQPPHSVIMHLVQGPFRSFKGEWQVTALSETACKVSLHMAFSLDNKALALAARALFNPMADNLVDAVVKRANKLYS